MNKTIYELQVLHHYICLPSGLAHDWQLQACKEQQQIDFELGKSTAHSMHAHKCVTLEFMAMLSSRCGLTASGRSSISGTFPL